MTRLGAGIGGVYFKIAGQFTMVIKMGFSFSFWPKFQYRITIVVVVVLMLLLTLEISR